MGWDAYFRSGFHPDGAFCGSRKEQERRTSMEYTLEVTHWPRGGRNVPQRVMLWCQRSPSDQTLALCFKEQLVRDEETWVKATNEKKMVNRDGCLQTSRK